VVAKALKRPLLPHQQHIADVACQLNPPGSWLYWRYQTVILLLPRQTGKTTVMRPILTERALSMPGRRSFITAQKRQTARERWLDLATDVERSPLSSLVTLKRGVGAEKMLFQTGSTIAPFTPDADGLHGESPDDVLIDEAWAFTAEQGSELVKAYRPAMVTRRARQVWIISAQGTAESQWLNELIETGRESINDPASNVCYIEWSADPAADPYDPATWNYHPGLDGLITLDDLAEEAKPENNSHSEFLRGFLNLPTKVKDTVIDLDLWTSLQADIKPSGMPVVAYDVAVDASAATIAAAWKTPTGVHVSVLESRENVDWLAPRLGELHAAGLVTAFHADDGGPARVTTDTLRRAGISVETLAGRDSGTAWAAFRQAINAGTLTHDASQTALDALSVLVTKNVGDGTTPDRRRSRGPIDPIIAEMVAAWAAEHTQTTIPIT
jgi:phage terminase large subunit-like protein